MATFYGLFLSNDNYKDCFSVNKEEKKITLGEDLSFNTYQDLSGTYIEISGNYTFDGSGYLIDFNKNVTWKGLIHDVGNDSSANKITVQNIGFNNGILQESNTGFLIRYDSNKIVQYLDISKCYIESDSDISGESCGGLIGMNAGISGEINILNCYNSGTISGNYSGGIVGKYCAKNKGHAIIKNCYNDGEIESNGSGGICGDSSCFNQGSLRIISCFNHGDISKIENHGSQEGDEHVASGGIVGSNAGGKNGSIIMIDVYSTLRFTAKIYGGSIFGENAGFDNGNVTITNAYSIYQKIFANHKIADNCNDFSSNYLYEITQSDICGQPIYSISDISGDITEKFTDFTNFVQDSFNNENENQSNRRNYPLLKGFRDSPWESMTNYDIHPRFLNNDSDYNEITMQIKFKPIKIENNVSTLIQSGAFLFFDDFGNYRGVVVTEETISKDNYYTAEIIFHNTDESINLYLCHTYNIPTDNTGMHNLFESSILIRNNIPYSESTDLGAVVIYGAFAPIGPTKRSIIQYVFKDKVSDEKTFEFEIRKAISDIFYGKEEFLNIISINVNYVDVNTSITSIRSRSTPVQDTIANIEVETSAETDVINVLDHTENTKIGDYIIKKAPILLARSNICFNGKSMVMTDSGEVKLENLDKNKHTIRGQDIVCVTQTLHTDNYMVLIEANALGKNMPVRDTEITGNHKIKYKGKMVKAQELLNEKGVKKVKYNGEILYNVLMKKHSVMRINNIKSETLDPKNIIGILNSPLLKLSSEEKNKTIFKLNRCIEDRNEKEYIRIVDEYKKSELKRRRRMFRV